MVQVGDGHRVMMPHVCGCRKSTKYKQYINKEFTKSDLNITYKTPAYAKGFGVSKS